MTEEEEELIKSSRRDFSIVVSSRNKTASLFLGPARFANHDCGASARLMTTGTNGMEIIAVRDIEIGEEITVSYGMLSFYDVKRAMLNSKQARIISAKTIANVYARLARNNV